MLAKTELSPAALLSMRMPMESLLLVQMTHTVPEKEPVI